MTRRHHPFAVALAALLLLTTASAALADDTTTVTVQVTENPLDGTFSAYFDYAYFNQVESSPIEDRVSPGYVTMFVDDLRGNDLAWEVQFSVGDFVGQDTGGVLLASNLSDQTAYLYDYGTSPSFDPYNPALQTFDAVTGVWSASGDQTGRYYSEWFANLTIPAGTAADFYTSELTLEIVSAP